MDRRPITMTTQKRLGDARAPGALPKILKSRGLAWRAATAEQIHGNAIKWVPKLSKAQKFRGIDGFFTEASNQPLVVFTADCLPVFVRAGHGKVVGLLHAGW